MVSKTPLDPSTNNFFVLSVAGHTLLDSYDDNMRCCSHRHELMVQEREVECAKVLYTNWMDMFAVDRV